MKNNIAFPNKTAYIGGEYAAGEYNTWNLNITPKESDFVSVSDPSMTVTGEELGPLGGAFGPRQADGSLPDIDFLKLAKNSQMIDKGVNVGLKYEGKAPDLGAYEYGYVAPVIVPVDTSVASADSSTTALAASPFAFTAAVAYNASTRTLTVHHNGLGKSVRIYTVGGKNTYEQSLGGTSAETMVLPASIANGVYFVQVVMPRSVSNARVQKIKVTE